MGQNKVALLMSGGVDSSVAAILLKEKGFDIVGIHLKVSNFCNPQDEYDARRVAEILKIPFYVIDITPEYQRMVVLDMIKNYAMGYTPNPDVECNRLVKFGLVFKKIKKLGFKYLATGHYAKIVKNVKIKVNNKSYKLPYAIMCAKDKEKDQTYFLWGINKAYLKNLIFPIGDFLKSEVRNIAKQYGLPNAEKKDSQGICFLGKIKLSDYLKEFLPEKSGPIYNTKGEVLGYHQGYYFFTEGQRHGLNIKKGDGPYFVAVKDKKRNALIVAKEEEDILYTLAIKIRRVNLFIDFKNIKEIKVLARCRYRQPLVNAILDLENKTVKFESPIKAIAPGQSIVFYHNDVLLGGAIIHKRI